MQKIIEELAAQVDASLAGVTSSESLAAFWQEYLSKNGKVPGLMKQLRTVPKEERPAAGKIINEFKGKVEAEYEAAAARIKAEELAARKAAYVQPEPNIKTGWLARYARMVTSANLGAVVQ